MPHVIVKLCPGRTEEQKQLLADAIVKNLIEIIDTNEDAVSVAIEEISAEDWTDKVYRAEILGRQETLYKKPGYDPL
jgi:4-oxalocrotonate tautomerase